MEFHRKRVAIFHSGQPSIHVYYLLEQLQKNKLPVDVYQYLPRKADRIAFKKEVLGKIKTAASVNHVFNCRLIDSVLVKAGYLIQRFGLEGHAFTTNFFLPYRTRQFFKADHYDYIITIEQAALYWLYKTDPRALQKTFHYSLEIQKETDPQFITPFVRRKLQWEQILLRKVHGLIIQDAYRAEALLGTSPANLPLRVFNLPVSIPGDSYTTHNPDFFSQRFGIDKEKKILLYFGSNFQERQLEDLATVFSRAQLTNWTLVLHGPDDFGLAPEPPENIKVSNNLLSFDELNAVIASATIGLALYDNSWPNTRYTAFASEKIARYLQAGVPFIAFRNESYEGLKAQFDCCELIDTIAELPGAVTTIEQNYAHYRTNAIRAFDTLYHLDKTILPLVRYLTTEQPEAVPLVTNTAC